jgi:hypothetical protein
VSYGAVIAFSSRGHGFFGVLGGGSASDTYNRCTRSTLSRCLPASRRLLKVLMWRQDGVV